MKETDILRAELERLFDLEELLQLARDILGFELEQVGGTAAKASFAGALTAHCLEHDAVEALCDVLLATRDDVAPAVHEIRRTGFSLDPEIAPGEAFGPFTDLRKLGEGRLARSYTGDRGGVPHRIRILRHEATRDQRGVHRFMTVVRLAATIEHPGLPRGLEVGTIQGRVYVAHEHVAGLSLSEHLRDHGPLPVEEATALARAILEALSALHARRIAHGDVRPENVLVSRSSDGELAAVLLDVGSDRLRSRPRLDNGRTELFATVGSPRTVAPEQVRGLPSTPQSDLYSIGALLYEMLTGSPPFGTNAIEAAFGHVSQAPTPPSQAAPGRGIGPDLDAFVLRLLEKEPSRRPLDAEAALEAFAEVSRVRVPSRRTLRPEDVDTLVATLARTPTDEATALALESAAETPELAERIVGVLYTASNLLKDRSEHLEQRRSLLFRAARVAAAWPETRARAEEFYGKLLEIAQDDEIALRGLVELRRRLGKYEEAIEVLLARAERVGSGSEKAATFAEIGRIYLRDLDDKEQALVAFTQAFAEDPGRAEWSNEIQRLAGANLERWQEVLETLGEAAQNPELSPDQRVLLQKRVGKWWMERAHRPDLALPLFQAVLAVEPAEDTALAGLAQIYRKAQQWNELGLVLTRRADAAATPALRRDYRAELAELLDLHLQDPNAARAILEEIVEQDPGHARAAQHLAKLYERASDYSALVRLLERTAEGQRGDERTKTTCRIAEIFEVHLNDDLEARRRYDAVLDQDPYCLDALRGLERLFAKTGRYEELLDNLEQQIERSATPRQKIALLERIATLYDEEFLDHDKAAVALERVLELDPAHERALSELARHYRAAERWEDVAAVLDRHQKTLDDPGRRVPLLLERARVLADPVGSPSRAVAAYEELLALDPTHAEALDQLARLREAIGDADAALEAIEALAKNADRADARAEHWVRAAKLLESRNDLDGAIERYKRALDEQPMNAAAMEGLRDAYATRGDARAAIQLIERELEHTEGALAKAKLAARMAVLFRTRVQDAEEAKRHAERAIELDPTNLEAHVVLGDIAFEARRFAEAARHFEAVSARTDTLPVDEAVRLLVRYVDALFQTGEGEKALTPTEKLKDLAPDDAGALERVAQVTFEHGSPERAAELYEELLSRFGDGLERSAHVRALYRRGEALRRAGMLEAAVLPLEEALELEPSALEPLIALERAYEGLERWQDLLKTKSRHLDVASEAERVDLLTEMGDIAAGKLGDRAQAARDYVAALEERPNDRKLLTKLMQLYGEEKDWNKLVEVVLRLAEFVEEPAQKVKYLHTAAIVTGRQIGDVDKALEIYREVLELDPKLDKAIGEALELHRARGDHAAVERLLKQRLELATSQKDEPMMIATFDALGALYEKELGKPDHAVDAYEAAQTLDPDNDDRAERLAALYAATPKRYFDKAVAAQLTLLQKSPLRVEPYRALRRLYTEAKRADAAWCLCQALSVLELSEPDEERFYRRMRADTAAPAQQPLADEDWFAHVLHPDADPLLSSVFALIEPAVIAKRSQSITELGYDEVYRVPLETHAAPVCQSLYFAAGVLGIEVPPAYENPNDPGGISFLFAHRPSLVLGRAAMSPDVPLQPAAFLAAQKLAYLRPGMYLRHLLASGTALKAWLFAAIKLTSPQFPVAPELEGAVIEAASALEAGLQGPARDHLTRVVSKLLASGAALDLKRWVAAVDLTADRAGLIVAHDLDNALALVRAADESSSSVPVERRVQELILYSVSPAYLAIRERLGISLES